MSLKKFATLAVMGGVTLGLIGCGAKSDVTDPYEDKSSGMSAAAGFYGEDISAEEELGLLSKRVVYFAYDSYELTPADMRVLKVHAKNLLDHPKLHLRIAGHTDTRGSREYNIGLGERRAKAVMRFLETKGVPSSQMSAVSYGKEQLLDAGNTEQAHAQNRRAALEYEGPN
jgi:peptidoglycan-associated lipoprotein